MKQIKVCLDRAFDGKKPLSKKWRAMISDGKLVLVHYQHLILIYDIVTHEVLHSFYERPADKRGLDSALKYLQKKREGVK